MAEPFLSEIRVFPFNFAPKGWAFCNGQTLPINQNQALFSLIGTFYGGNGTTNFQLPNLQGTVAIHQGTGPSGTSYVLGAMGGAANVTLLQTQIPAHTHLLEASTGTASTSNPNGSLLAIPDVNPRMQNLYGTSGSVLLASSAIETQGGSQPHSNFQPATVLNFCIALVGIFPSRS